MSSAPDQVAKEEDAGQKRKAMEAMLDRDTAIAELLYEFLREREQQDASPEETLAREAYQNMVDLGLDTSQVLAGTKRARALANLTHNFGLLPQQVDDPQPVETSAVLLTSRQLQATGTSEGTTLSSTLPASNTQISAHGPSPAATAFFPPLNHFSGICGDAAHNKPQARAFWSQNSNDSQLQGQPLEVFLPLALNPLKLRGSYMLGHFTNAAQGLQGSALCSQQSGNCEVPSMRTHHAQQQLAPNPARSSGRSLGDRLESRSSIDSLASLCSRGSRGTLGNPRNSQGSQGMRVAAPQGSSQGGIEERPRGQNPRDEEVKRHDGPVTSLQKKPHTLEKGVLLAASTSLPWNQLPAAKDSQAHDTLFMSSPTQVLCPGHSQAGNSLSREDGILSGSSLLSELRSQGSRMMRPAMDLHRQQPSQLSTHEEFASEMNPASLSQALLTTGPAAGRPNGGQPLEPTNCHFSCGADDLSRDDKSGQCSLLEQLLRDTMSNLSAEQEAQLVAGMVSKAVANPPGSPNSRMKEESMLAGMGVIAPEEIGLKRLRNAPVKDGGLLAQLNARIECERLFGETPSPSGEGTFLSKLRTMSSSEDAHARNSSGGPSAVSGHPSLRETSLLGKLRVQVAREAALAGLGGRQSVGRADAIQSVSSGQSDGGATSSQVPPPPAMVPSGAASLTATPLASFGTGNVAIRAARGRSEELSNIGSGNTLPVNAPGPLTMVDTFGSGCVAAEIAKLGSLEGRSGSLQTFGSGQLAAELARGGPCDDSILGCSTAHLTAADLAHRLRPEALGLARSASSPPPKPARTASWRVQSGGSAQSEAVLTERLPKISPDVTPSIKPAGLEAQPLTAQGRRVPPRIPISQFSLDGVPGWRPPPSPTHLGTSPPRTASAGQDDSGGSRMWTVNSLSSWAKGDRSNKLQSRSSLHSRSSIQSQPSFHSWAGPGSAPASQAAAATSKGAKTDSMQFAARWSTASLDHPHPQWPKSSPNAATWRSTGWGRLPRQNMMAPASPGKTHSSDGSPRRATDECVRPSEGLPLPDHGSPTGSQAGFQKHLNPLQPCSPETGSGSASPSRARNPQISERHPAQRSQEELPDEKQCIDQCVATNEYKCPKAGACSCLGEVCR